MQNSTSGVEMQVLQQLLLLEGEPVLRSFSSRNLSSKIRDKIPNNKISL